MVIGTLAFLHCCFQSLRKVNIIYLLTYMQRDAASLEITFYKYIIGAILQRYLGITFWLACVMDELATAKKQLL